MTRNRLLIAFASIVLTGTAIFGQQPTARPTPRPAAPQTAAPQTAGPIPEGRMALIYSEDFRDPKTGIARYSAVMASLTAEFQPRQTEMNQMAQRMQQLQDEITRLQGPAPVAPAQIQAKGEQYELLKKDYQRKGEDAQAAYKKRHDEAMAPLNNEIAKALEAYAKARNITVIIDGNQVPLVYAVENIDITRAFINDFNSKNPVTASATPRP